MSFSFWDQVERGEKPVTKRSTLEAMADALRVHPTELSGQPWIPWSPVDAQTQAALDAIETALECYQLGVDPGIPVRPWPHIWRTSIALERCEHGQALQAAHAVHPELLPATVHQAGFWADVGRALAAEKKTRDKAVHVLVHAEQLAPQRIRHDLLVREAVTGLLCQARRDAGGRQLRGLAWRMGVAPLG